LWKGKWIEGVRVEYRELKEKKREFGRRCRKKYLRLANSLGNEEWQGPKVCALGDAKAVFCRFLYAI